MKKVKKLLLLTMLTSCAFSSNAQGSATATVNASAKIIATISIDELLPMSFGELTNDAGTVILKTNGDITDDADGTRKVGGTSSAGGFNVNGGTGENFKLQITSTVLTNQNGNNETMAISAIKVKQDEAADVLMEANGVSMTLTGTTDIIKIGASLTVSASQVAGNYKGTMTVTVAYE
jgi:spore coat protein U-like protein